METPHGSRHGAPLPCARSARSHAERASTHKGRGHARLRAWGVGPSRFGGKEEDSEVGLSYFGARYYSPQLMAWLSADPVTIHELGSDTNPYAYVRGSPLMGVDPDGREPLSILAIIGISMAVGALVGAGSSVAIQATQGNGWDFRRVNGWKVLGAGGMPSQGG